MSASWRASQAGRWAGIMVGLAGLTIALAGYGCFWMGKAGAWYGYRVLAYPGIALIGLGASLIYQARTGPTATRQEPPRASQCRACGRWNPPGSWSCAHCEASLDWEPDQPSP